MDLEALRNGKPLIGTMLRVVRNPAIANIAREADLDFIMPDMEHGDYSFETLSAIFGAARAVGLGAFVRVPELARGYVSRALDCGASGVMAPMLETVEQAGRLVEWAKFPPVGKRGLSGAGGNTGYACNGSATEMMAKGNAETLAIAQIETRTAIENIDAIAAVDGIDVLLIGPNDLAVSLGCAGDLASPEHGAAIGKVADAAEKHGKIFGMHAGKPLLEKWAGRNLRFVMYSLDINVLADGLKLCVDDVRQHIEQAS